ncbi:MAG: DUF2505 domain-containing protein [Mycobacteriaceae bacterium]|nr:DUF2505 domain-containing protein [Mycobacteriaceae bacterium]MBV9640059.1 DUF2505 domain-containing protein [Mycobacteriaceae bacterium]
MPRSFDLSAYYPVGVEVVRAAFSDEEYWLARLADSGADAATLDSMVVEDDGRVIVATTQALRPDRLPAVVTQFHRGDLQIVRHESWSPVTRGTAHAELSGSVRGAPVSLAGTAELAATETGSCMTFTATVEVNVPLVGGKLESFIGGKLAELVSAEQRFTTLWITENA